MKRLLIVLCCIAAPAAAFAQLPAIHYVYDDLNRLIGIVDQQGNAATYTYDAVGNLLTIERFDTPPGAVAISLFTPPAGVTGATVQIFGRGFDPSASANAVRFNGTLATVSAAAPNRLVADVPAGASTGPISVTNTNGSGASATEFRVLGVLAVTPSTAFVQVTRQAQFSVTEGGTPATKVRWAVNGITGGDPSFGSVTPDGLYTAPLVRPQPPTVSVTATHQDDASLSASATVTIEPPITAIIASRPVSVALAAPPLIVDKSVTTVVSVHVGTDPQGTAAGSLLSVLVSPVQTALGSSPLVSVALEPVVSSLSPASAEADAITFTLTVLGRGLGDVTSLVFLHNNVVDSTITVTNLDASPDGTEVTADVTVGTTAAAGARVVRITTAAGTSTAAGTGGNVFHVQ